MYGGFYKGPCLGGSCSRGFLKERMVWGVEAGASGERGMWIVLVRRGWRLGVRALCIGGGR
ncbi:hypothetical protein [Bartonella schoenbuchensis]|uniref:Acetyl-CoA C-acetyltransferase n=2 Tax=Bartonella schoenbuchensis TaxID=165694 RepID=E6Z1E6_BARSR